MQPLEAAVFATINPDLNLHPVSIFPTRFQWCMCLPFGKNKYPMTSSSKIQVVAGGLVLITIFSNSLLLLLTENANLVKMAMQLSFAAIFSYAIIHRARWARWTVGVLCGFGVFATTLLLLLSWEQSSVIILSWVGIPLLVMFLFHSWVAYTLLFDKEVSQLFSGESSSNTA